MKRAPRLMAALLGCTAATVMSSALSPAAAAPAHAPATPVQHLVVMTQDQHTFDNYLGNRPGVDGIPSGTCVPLRSGSHDPCVAPYALPGAPAREQLQVSGKAQQASVAGGRMDGFVHAQATHRSDGKLTMAHYPAADVTGLNQLADQGVLFDHWFSAVPGGPIPNRLFEISAVSPGDRLDVPKAGWGDVTTIFDRLTAAGVSWRVYVENYEPALTVATASARALRGGQVARVPLLAIPRVLRDPALMAHVVDLSQYYTDIASGQLPAVSYVVSTSSSEHAPASPARGQRLAQTVVNALIASADWKTSAFLLDYDSWGGWYDHVAPPTVDGAPLGLRVPALLISPYATPGRVEHTSYEPAAVLRFIERNWSLDPLTRRDRDAADLAAAFTFTAAPHKPALIGTGSEHRAVQQPRRATLYLGYGVAVAVAASVVVWTAVSDRRRRRPVGVAA